MLQKHPNNITNPKDCDETGPRFKGSTPLYISTF